MLTFTDNFRDGIMKFETMKTADKQKNTTYDTGFSLCGVICKLGALCSELKTREANPARTQNPGLLCATQENPYNLTIFGKIKKSLYF